MQLCTATWIQATLSILFQLLWVQPLVDLSSSRSSHIWLVALSVAVFSLLHLEAMSPFLRSLCVRVCVCVCVCFVSLCLLFEVGLCKCKLLIVPTVFNY